jgi:hypothetical protein
MGQLESLRELKITESKHYIKYFREVLKSQTNEPKKNFQTHVARVFK